MINQDDCFKKFNIQSIIVSKNYKRLIQEAVWSHDVGFKNFSIPKFVWMTEPLLKVVNEQFPIERCVVLEMLANSVYNWHTDFFRGASINMKLITENRSHTFFGQTLDDFSDSFVELNYEKDTFYLFNTQYKHSVVNFDTTRYMFSLEFKQDKDSLNYSTIYDWCEQNGLF